MNRIGETGDNPETKDWQLQAIQEEIQAADEGRLIDHDTLKAKWEKLRTLAAN